MKKLVFIGLFILAVCFACDKNEDNGEKDTAILGRPLSIENNERYFAEMVYKDENSNTLESIVPFMGYIRVLEYNNGQLVKCRYKNVTESLTRDDDFISFEHHENVITVKFNVAQTYRTDTIVVGESGYPDHITVGDEINSFFRTMYFTLDESSQLISQMNSIDIYPDGNVYGSEIRDYLYDDNPGVSKLVDCPRWFITYLVYVLVPGELGEKQLLNTKHNLIQEKITYYYQGEFTSSITYDYKYKYGKDNFPISVRDELSGLEMKISY